MKALKMQWTVKAGLTLWLIIGLSSVHAGDAARERRMADEIIDTIIDGDAVFLTAADQTFLSIYTQAEEAKGVAVILHGRGFHPDWQDAINPMRVGLAEAGWDTLSVQMPVLDKHAKYYDYVPIFHQALPRIDTAIRFAREKNNKVILIAHSCGAHMAMAWVEGRSDAGIPLKIDAYVGIGMGATDYGQPMKKLLPLNKIDVPVLDVYAEEDFPAVIKMAPERLGMINKAGNKKSKQAVISDAQHYYVDRGDELTKIIGQWLESL